MAKQNAATYEPGECPICEVKETKLRGKCDECKKPIPNYELMNGAAFRSPRIDHYHFTRLGDLSGRSVVSQELCRECYFKDYNDFYKDKKGVNLLKMEDLPREIKYT